MVQAIAKAKKSVEIMIFRFDQPEMERALTDAVERGVFVHALIAFTNRGGEDNLRKLERRFLNHGITVARTADDLIRYHGKMIAVDRQELYLLGFNFTHQDIDHSRSFGLMIRNPSLVTEAVRLFEADSKRQHFSANLRDFLVSPVNARRELTRFIKGAQKELLIYDPKISDPAMLDLLKERQASSSKSLDEEVSSSPGPARRTPIGLLESVVQRIPFPSVVKQIRKLLPKRRRLDKRNIRGALRRMVTNIVGKTGTQSVVKRTKHLA